MFAMWAEWRMDYMARLHEARMLYRRAGAVSEPAADRTVHWSDCPAWTDSMNPCDCQAEGPIIA